MRPQYLVGDGPGAGAENASHGRAGGGQERDTGQHEYHEVKIANGLAEVQPHEARKQREAANARGHNRVPACGRGGQRATIVGRRVASRCAKHGPLKPEAPEAQRHQRNAEPQPKGAIGRKYADEGYEGSVAIIDRPVTRDRRCSDDAERVDQRCQCFVVNVAKQISRDQVAHQRQHAADVHRQHLARQRGDAEKYAAQPHDVGNQHRHQGRQVRHEMLGAEPVRHDRRQESRQPRTQRDAREDHQQHQ